MGVWRYSFMLFKFLVILLYCKFDEEKVCGMWVVFGWSYWWSLRVSRWSVD